jgi:hypothetical protein
LNFSEFFPGINSLIIYPTSKVIAAKIESPNFIVMGKTKLNEYLVRYDPEWQIFRDDFVRCLWDNYIELRKLRDDYWITVQDLKDLVCYKLQLSESTFQLFLECAYKESMNETIRQFKISLEVDRSPEERTLVNSKRYPIFINNKPINIIGIQMR